MINEATSLKQKPTTLLKAWAHSSCKWGATEEESLWLRLPLWDQLGFGHLRHPLLHLPAQGLLRDGWGPILLLMGANMRGVTEPESRLQ